MSDKVLHFDGSVPGNYEDHLGPFLFESFAVDLAGRVDGQGVEKVLELACGTGRLTRHLLMRLSPGAQLTASDLNPAMLEVAMEKLPDAKLVWATVDMLNIPYEDESFDLIVCQFGLMLVPDRPRALKEIYRVLQPGGKLIFSVWGSIKDNLIWKIGGEVVHSFLGIDPILQDPGPFSMDPQSGIELMIRAGFSNSRVTRVRQTGVAGQAALAAKGFIHGLPVVNIIKQKDPGLILKIQEELADALIRELGDQPMRSPLAALVFEAEK